MPIFFHYKNRFELNNVTRSLNILRINGIDVSHCFKKALTNIYFVYAKNIEATGNLFRDKVICLKRYL